MIIDKGKIKILDGYLKKEKITEPEQFNKWFNKQFEKTKVDREDETHGYGNWLKSDNDLGEFKNVSFTQMEREFELKNPEGKIVKGRNVKNFCLENNLCYSCIMDILNERGNRHQHKGWTRP